VFLVAMVLKESAEPQGYENNYEGKDFSFK
jgi:hypothetical protein